MFSLERDERILMIGAGGAEGNETTTMSDEATTKIASSSTTHELSGELTDSLSLDLSVDGAKLQLSVVVVPQYDGKSVIKYRVKLVSTANSVCSTAGGASEGEIVVEGASEGEVVVEEVFPDTGEDWHSKTYDEFAVMASERGGRLATREEIIGHEIIGRSQSGDQWVPVSGTKDWVQIKDHRMHVSHVAGYGYPDWGDRVIPCHWRGHSFVIAKFV
jgi:hypothetical protein